jgi:hypothetical protein
MRILFRRSGFCLFASPDIQFGGWHQMTHSDGERVMEELIDQGSSARPECFGNPNKVCPRDELGFIDPQPFCMPCPVFKTCLQVALRKYGLVAPPCRSEQVTSGLLGFVKRWSDRKLAQRRSADDGNDDSR